MPLPFRGRSHGPNSLLNMDRHVDLVVRSPESNCIVADCPAGEMFMCGRKQARFEHGRFSRAIRPANHADLRGIPGWLAKRQTEIFDSSKILMTISLIPACSSGIPEQILSPGPPSTGPSVIYQGPAARQAEAKEYRHEDP